MTLGFLGSFGHCVGMCGPLTIAFSLSQQTAFPPKTSLKLEQQLYFHGLLNLGRMISYTLVGAGIGALGSVLVAGGQLAGIDSGLRQGLTFFTGTVLIWMGLAQINPRLLAKIPLLHVMRLGELHQWLSDVMLHLARQVHGLTPALLGIAWGLIPCGFLYAAQIKAAETADLWKGAATMMAFGLGTLPSMLGVGLSASFMSAERRSQLFRLGGWLMLIIGGLTLLRTGDTTTDFAGHASLFCLMLALIARPISRLWAEPLRYRRGLGIGAFILAFVHTLHMLQHTLNWNLKAIAFMLPEQQYALWAGLAALILMLPAACTSFDWMMLTLGQYWRHIHLLTIPALILCVIHAVLIGSHYLGELNQSWACWLSVLMLVGLTLLVLLVRLRWFWSLLLLEQFYTPVAKPSLKSE
jgi:sulfite exporter TauE/SafE